MGYMFYVWIAVMVIAVVFEIITNDLTSIWFAVGGALALISNLFLKDELIAVQVGIFAVVSIVAILVVKPLLKKKFDKFLYDHHATIQVREGYGTTETVTACCLTPPTMYKEGSIGIPFPDTYIKIVEPDTDNELPYGEDYLITVMDDSNWDYIKEQIQRADSQADFVIVCPHWGDENQVGDPTAYQVEWGQMFTEAGADLILGTHPHVIERIEWITAENGNQALCYYSLGNFVSNQQYTDLVLGGMAYVEIEKDEQGAHIVADSAKVVPVVTHNDKTGDPVVIQTYYLTDYTQDLADVHDTYLTYDDAFSLDLLKQKAQNVFGSWMIDRLP